MIWHGIGQSTHERQGSRTIKNPRSSTGGNSLRLEEMNVFEVRACLGHTPPCQIITLRVGRNMMYEHAIEWCSSTTVLMTWHDAMALTREHASSQHTKFGLPDSGSQKSCSGAEWHPYISKLVAPCPTCTRLSGWAGPERLKSCVGDLVYVENMCGWKESAKHKRKDNYKKRNITLDW